VQRLLRLAAQLGGDNHKFEADADGGASPGLHELLERWSFPWRALDDPDLVTITRLELERADLAAVHPEVVAIWQVSMLGQ
jgi:hypothetical protein